MSKLKTSELPVYIELDKVLVGYLSTITKMSINEVVSVIRDLADKPLNRLRKRNGKFSSNMEKFGNTDIMLKLHCKRRLDINKMRADDAEYYERFNREHNTTITHWNHPSWKSWSAQNPRPSIVNNYESIIITAEVCNNDKMMRLTDDEVSLLAIESIFLGSSLRDERLEQSTNQDLSEQTDAALPEQHCQDEQC